MVSDTQKEAIRKEARELLDGFATSLERVSMKKSKSNTPLSNGIREEGKGLEPNENFRKRIFTNAPKKSDDFLIAEKAGW